MPNDQTTLDLAHLLDAARSSAYIVSGSLPGNVYGSPAVQAALEKAVANNVTFEVIVGRSPDEKTHSKLQSLGIMPNVIDRDINRHFIVVDNQHVRLEIPHESSVNSCVQFVVFDHPDVDKYINLFLDLKGSISESYIH